MLGLAARFIERPPLLLLNLATRITSAHPPPPPPPPLLFTQSRFRFFSATNTNNNNNIMVISIHNSHNADCLDFLSGIVWFFSLFCNLTISIVSQADSEKKPEIEDLEKKKKKEEKVFFFLKLNFKYSIAVWFLRVWVADCDVFD